MFVESTENSKKGKVRSQAWNHCFYVFLIWVVIFRNYVLHTFICWNPCSKYVWHVLVMNLGIIIWLEIIILRSPEKGVPWKFWLDPRFLRNPILKWILRWLPLDRGYFKFLLFTKRESFLIISYHIYVLTRNLSFYFKSCSHCHAFCLCWIVP